MKNIKSLISCGIFFAALLLPGLCFVAHAAPASAGPASTDATDADGRTAPLPAEVAGGYFVRSFDFPRPQYGEHVADAGFGKMLVAFLRAHPGYEVVSVTPISHTIGRETSGLTTAVVVVFKLPDSRGR